MYMWSLDPLKCCYWLRDATHVAHQDDSDLPFNVKLRNVCQQASSSNTQRTIRFVFAGFFFWTENTDIFLDLGSLVSQDTECIHVN